MNVSICYFREGIKLTIQFVARAVRVQNYKQEGSAAQCVRGVCTQEMNLEKRLPHVLSLIITINFLIGKRRKAKCKGGGEVARKSTFEECICFFSSCFLFFYFFS